MQKTSNHRPTPILTHEHVKSPELVKCYPYISPKIEDRDILYFNRTNSINALSSNYLDAQNALRVIITTRNVYIFRCVFGCVFLAYISNDINPVEVVSSYLCDVILFYRIQLQPESVIIIDGVIPDDVRSSTPNLYILSDWGDEDKRRVFR